ncbi:tRNA pseudouridine(55) synthase TruB [Patescibacteria group bacterium]
MDPIGFINLNKPTGITSHGAAQKIRKIVGLRRVGHSGTLDPMASGVLVIAVGKATKLVEFLRKDDKTYEAVIRLGVTSDTYDATGQITETPPPVPMPSGGQVNSVLQQFTGEFEQMPPKYSAIKVQGKPAHRRMRQGEDVELEPRPVNIYETKLVEYNFPLISITVKCSAGTYIRSLAHDIGERLKTGAVLEALHRTQAGDFSINNSVELDSLSPENWSEHILPTTVGLTHLAKHVVNEEDAKRIPSGIKIKVDADLPTDKPIAILAPDKKTVLAVGEYLADEKVLKPTKVLAESGSNSID